MSSVECVVSDGVATVLISNRAKRNAMTTGMWSALPPLFDRLAADPDVQVVVLTGDGETFCAGADISTLTGLRPGVPTPAMLAEEALAGFPKPIAAGEPCRDRVLGWEEAGQQELAEGVAAFTERRAPNFPWRPSVAPASAGPATEATAGQA